MKNYQIYGLKLTANVALPGPVEIGLRQSDFPVVDVCVGELPCWLTARPQDAGTAPNWYPIPVASGTNNLEPDVLLRVWRINSAGTALAHREPIEQSGCYFYFLYDDDITFVVGSAGDRIWATWPDDLTLEDMATYLLGPILGFVLRLRGTVCLHANAIAIDDRVVVLVGTAGAGKSTTAAAFAQQGYAILSDDVVPLIDRGDRFLVQPAYPRIRLWNASVRALYGAPDALPRLVPTHPTWDKRYVDLSQTGYKFQQEPLPLAAIYYLNERRDDPGCPDIAPMAAHDRLITLITNTYTNYLLDKQLRAHEFELLSRVVKNIPLRQITPHTNIDRLPDLMTAVLRDLQTIPARA
jgi:hypothetical protein